MSLKQMQRGVLLIICGICACAAAVTTALAEKPPDEWVFPEMKALVLVESSGSGKSEVGVQVVGSLTDEQAKQIISQAGSAGGWSPGPVTVEHEVFQSGSMWEDITGNKAEPEVQTFARFQAAGLVNRETGELAVKDFVQALRDFSPVRVVYKVGEEFSFSGPEDEDFQGFHIAHYHGDGTHTFDAVAIEEPAPAAAPGAPAKAAPAATFPWLGLTLCVLAVAMAAGAGFWKWHLGKSQHKTTVERGDSSGS